MVFSELVLRWDNRKIKSDRQSQRDFLDFVIDGKSLYQTFETISYDLISCLGWGLQDEQQQAKLRLTLQASTDFPNQRQSLYICPECGDLGCGAISLRVVEQSGLIIWQDFGYENNFEDCVHWVPELTNLGPFRFDLNDYKGTILKAPSCM